MKKSFLALSAMALLFTACKKDKDEPAAITPTVQNLTGSYKLTDVRVKTGTSPEVSVYQDETFFENCQKDDTHILKADMTYEIKDAGTVCDPPGDYDDFWALTNNTTIEVDGEVFTIRKFDGKNLELTSDYMGSTGVYYYSKQ